MVKVYEWWDDDLELGGDGEYVRYDDYKAQAARIEQLEASLATARNDALREAAEEVTRENDRCLALASIRIPAMASEIRTAILALITKEAP